MKTWSECKCYSGKPPRGASQTGGSRDSAAHGTDGGVGQ